MITIRVESKPRPRRSPPSARISARPRTVNPRGVHGFVPVAYTSNDRVPHEYDPVLRELATGEVQRF